jgi:hypothetical protein
MAVQTPRRPIHPVTATDEIAALRHRLDPRTNRAEIADRYDEVFRAGSVPDPAPDGFLRGTLEMTTTTGALDAFGRSVTRLWMPWLGKRFDAATSTGVNRMRSSARGPMRVVWPSHRTTPIADGVEAFPFRTRVEPSALDAGTTVLVIDYDFEANPGLLIRRIRDELVRVDDGFFLGKVLLRLRDGYHRAGFFSLRRT